MATTSKGKRPVDRWVQLADSVRAQVPHLGAWLDEEEEFAELRLKRRDDGTTLAIAKGYGPDGGPIVCFGSGYGVWGALMAIDATIQGGRWRVDKPWSP